MRHTLRNENIATRPLCGRGTQPQKNQHRARTNTARTPFHARRQNLARTTPLRAKISRERRRKSRENATRAGMKKAGPSAGSARQVPAGRRAG